MFFNINDKVRVRLTEHGRKVHRENFETLRRRSMRPEALGAYKPPVEDAEGWSTWQLWELMREFGSSCYMGGPPPFRTVIDILQPET